METDSPTEVMIPGGSALGSFLYSKPAERHAGAIIRWWEARRLPYNLILGGAGAVSLGVVALVAALPPGGGLIGLPLIPIAVYGVLANVCYSLGPAVELALEKVWGRRLLPAGPLLFRAGLTFAVGLTLLPIILVTIGYLMRIIGVIV
jgi:hypothetical protein